MVYCTKCGEKNEEQAEACSKCGAKLKGSHFERKRRSNECFGSSGRRQEDECFGLPYGGAIVGLIFGILIVFMGLAILLGVDLWSYLGFIVLVVIGILIIAGSLFGLRRRY